MGISFHPRAPFCPISWPRGSAGAAGLALDFQVIGKAAAVLQLPTVNRNNGQEASGLCVRALLPALLTLGPPLVPFHGFVPVLAGRFPTLRGIAVSKLMAVQAGDFSRDWFSGRQEKPEALVEGSKSMCGT